jgi:predicted MFS family arabinose efflux permease
MADRTFGWRFTFPLLLGSTLNPINSSMLATGLVGIAADFHVGPGRAADLVSVLYLCSAVMQPTMGKLATLFGPRRVFLTGVAILLLGGALGGIAPSFAVLLVSRALIGAGSSACYPTAMALVRRRADRAGTGVPSRVLGNFSIAAQITVVFGLPIGGVLAGAFGWRALFLVNVPLAAITLVCALIGVAADGPLPPRGQAVRALDLPGIALFAAATVSLLIFLADLKHPAWWLLAAAPALLALLIVRERRAASPLIDVRMLAGNRPLQNTYLRAVLLGLGIYTSLYGASQWLEVSAGYSPFAVGLILLPLSGISIVLARLCSSRGWLRGPLILGAAALILTGVLLLLIDHGSGLFPLIGMSVMFGLTNGFCGFANQAVLYVQSPAETIAVAAGLFRTFSYLGAIFSASVIGLTFGDRATDAGLHHLAWVVLAIGAASLILTLADRHLPVSVGEGEPEPVPVPA